MDGRIVYRGPNLKEVNTVGDDWFIGKAEGFELRVQAKLKALLDYQSELLLRDLETEGSADDDLPEGISRCRDCNKLFIGVICSECDRWVDQVIEVSEGSEMNEIMG